MTFDKEMQKALEADGEKLRQLTGEDHGPRWSVEQYQRAARSMSVHVAKPEHEVAYQDICQLVNRHADKLNAIELLAIAANMLGKLVALQDQRTTSPAMAMEVVAKNIESGNKQVLDQLAKTKERQAT